ncbi:MAG: lysophospholipid acyltransferase family protein [Pseudobdellovibrio sp.]
MKKFASIFSSILSKLWSLVPFRINLCLGKVLAFLWVDVFQIRKKVIFNNLDLVFPNLTYDEKKRISIKSMQNMCRSFFDILKIPSLTDAWIEKNVIFDGLDNFKLAKSQEKGILFLSLHLGSGDLGGAIMSQKLLPVYIITKKIKNKFLNYFWFNMRGASNTQFIDAHSKKNAFEILGAIKKQAGVVFVLDQFMGKPYGILTNFFGKPTGTAYGLALFAKKTQSPVVPVCTYWDNNDVFHICFGQSIDLSNLFSDNGSSYITNATNRFNEELEKMILQHPEHWMWVHRRWKDFE